MSKLGFNSQLGVGAEGTYGTRVAAGRTLEFASESLSRDETRMPSQAIRSSNFQRRYALGQRAVGGDVTMELASVGQGLFWLHALGEVAITTPATATLTRLHTYTPAALDGKGLSVQVVRDDIPFDYTGCKVASLGVSCQVGQIAQMQVSLAGQDELVDQSAAAAAYPTGLELLTFVGGSLSLGGSTLDVQSADLTLNNTLNASRPKFGSRVTRQPLRNGFRSLTGSFEVNFEGLTLYNRYISGALATLILEFEGLTVIEGAFLPSVTITSEVRTDGSTPSVSGPGEIMQTIPFEAFPGDAGTDDDVITVEVQTSDTAA